MKFLSAVVLAAVAAATSVAADAATFDYRFAFKQGSTSNIVAGTLTATEIAPGSYTIDSADGRFFDSAGNDFGSVAGAGPNFDGNGPSFSFAGTALETFQGTFFGDRFFAIDYSPTTNFGFFVEVGGELTEASVTAAAGVPEPATWALMIAGMGAVGGAMRRRRTSVRYAAA